MHSTRSGHKNFGILTPLLGQKIFWAQTHIGNRPGVPNLNTQVETPGAGIQSNRTNLNGNQPRDNSCQHKVLVMRPSEQLSPYSLTWVKIAHPGVKTCNFWQDESFWKEHWYEGGWFGTAIKPHPSSTLSWNHPDTFQVIFPSGLWRLHIMSNPQNNTQLRERLQNRTGAAKHELKPWTRGPRIQEFGINRTQRNFSKNSRVIERIAHPSNPSEI